MRTTFQIIAALLLGVSLTGCATEQPATGAQLEKLAATCRGYGLQSGTEAFSNCLYQLDQQRMANAYNRRMAAAAALGNAGAQMQANAAQTYRPAVRCTSTPSSSWVGGPVSQVRTTCY